MARAIKERLSSDTLLSLTPHNSFFFCSVSFPAAGGRSGSSSKNLIWRCLSTLPLSFPVRLAFSLCRDLCDVLLRAGLGCLFLLLLRLLLKLLAPFRCRFQSLPFVHLIFFRPFLVLIFFACCARPARAGRRQTWRPRSGYGGCAQRPGARRRAPARR